MLFSGKRIVLGVSGSIAAYKAVYLLRLLTEAGAEVAPVLTRGATEFVAPMTFSSLAKRAAITDPWSAAQAGEIGHVELAHWADLLVVAPATANTIARVAHGLADDPLAAIALATAAPIVIAPAMEDRMWHNAITQANVARLAELGVLFVAPTDGALASGRRGSGRLAEPEIIVQALASRLAPQDLRGERVVVSAGPTREHIDPVRFISNPSSGKMGYAIAQAARSRGAAVTLVSGPSALPTPWGVERVDVTSTTQMLEACQAALNDATMLIMAAAPADFTPRERHEHKQRKGELADTLALTHTPDILKSLERRPDQIIIGFAAETRDIEESGQAKLRAKGLDAIVANDVGGEETGFGSERNQGTWLDRDGERATLGPAPKGDMAHQLLERAAKLRGKRTP